MPWNLLKENTVRYDLPTDFIASSIEGVDGMSHTSCTLSGPNTTIMRM